MNESYESIKRILGISSIVILVSLMGFDGFKSEMTGLLLVTQVIVFKRSRFQSALIMTRPVLSRTGCRCRKSKLTTDFAQNLSEPKCVRDLPFSPSLDCNYVSVYLSSVSSLRLPGTHTLGDAQCDIPCGSNDPGRVLCLLGLRLS